MDYDVAIIGGGPGGCMAALHAAKNGATVCVLEKTRDIGYPVRCGEAMGEEAIKQFFKPKVLQKRSQDGQSRTMFFVAFASLDPPGRPRSAKGCPK